MRRSAGKRKQQSHTRMRFTVGVDVRVDVSAGIRGLSRQLSGWDDDGDVREDHDHATNRPQMMKTMFRRGIPPPPPSMQPGRTDMFVPLSMWREHFTVTGNLRCSVRRGKRIRVTQHANRQSSSSSSSSEHLTLNKTSRDCCYGSD